MPPGFPGFPAEGMQFLRGLARNNRREWFQPRKHIFDAHVRAPMEAMVEALNRAMAEFAPLYAIDPGQAIYRIYRDTRFSADKTPYKTHIAASFSRRGTPRHGEGGYYFSVAAGEIEVGGGVYMPQPDALRAIRRHIAATHEDLREILRARPVRRLLGELQGDRLSRVPKGFCSEDPAADLLVFKSFLLFTTLPGEIAATPRLYAEVLARFRAMQPFIDYLAAPLVRPKARTPRPRRFDDRVLPVAF
jgi:uncharacterized protein (TIGR02453 family)